MGKFEKCHEFRDVDVKQKMCILFRADFERPGKRECNFYFDFALDTGCISKKPVAGLNYLDAV